MDFGANILCVAVLQELHRPGAEEQRSVRHLQAQRSWIWDENKFHHNIGVWASHVRQSEPTQVNQLFELIPTLFFYFELSLSVKGKRRSDKPFSLDDLGFTKMHS